MNDEERQNIVVYLKGLGYSETIPAEYIPNYPTRCVQLVMKNPHNELVFFSIMCISKNKSDLYYDYTTLTEWLFALQNKEHFYFIIYRRENEMEGERCHLLTIEQMFRYISVPPFKIAMNIKENTLIDKKYQKGKIINLDKLRNSISNMEFSRRRNVKVSPNKISTLIRSYFEYRNNK